MGKKPASGTRRKSPANGSGHRRGVSPPSLKPTGVATLPGGSTQGQAPGARPVIPDSGENAAKGHSTPADASQAPNQEIDLGSILNVENIYDGKCVSYLREYCSSEALNHPTGHPNQVMLAYLSDSAQAVRTQLLGPDRAASVSAANFLDSCWSEIVEFASRPDSKTVFELISIWKRNSFILDIREEVDPNLAPVATTYATAVVSPPKPNPPSPTGPEPAEEGETQPSNAEGMEVSDETSPNATPASSSTEPVSTNQTPPPAVEVNQFS